MAENIRQKINEWAEKFKPEETEETLRAIFEKMCKFSDEKEEADQVEKIVLFINQCIVLDALDRDNYKIADKTYTREDIVEKIKRTYEEFGLNSDFDEWENESTLAFKERVSYLIALILFKVHNYKEAYQYFVESRNFSAKLDNAKNVNGLDLLCRIKRDIHFAYCCEYIGTPTMHYEKVVESLEILLGTKDEFKDTNKYWKEYWQAFKKHSYNEFNKLERIFSSNKALVEKSIEIINILSGFSENRQSVLARLLEMRKKEEVELKYYNEAVHVLAHCLNEINMGLPVGGSNREEAMENYEKRNLMKMIACICIDSLGESCATCQATVRAEQGNGFDAIAQMHAVDEKNLKERDLAELDFYQYYFESMFPHQDLEKEHVHGEKFKDFCIKNKKSNQDIYQDGLLHYYIVSLKKQLKLFLEKFVNNPDKNAFFFQDDEKIQKSPCFECYKELKKKEFSKFVNVQMINEREKLIVIYEILQYLQNNKLPLFYERKNFDNELTINRNIKGLFDLCKRFNRFYKVNTKLLEEMDMDCFLDEQSNAHVNYDNVEFLRKSAENTDAIIRNGAPVLVEGLVFELYGNIDKFVSYFEKYSLTYYKIWQGERSVRDKLNFGNKILYVDNDQNCIDYCAKLCKSMSNKNIHVFYVGEPDEKLKDGNVAAFSSINICFLMAYIYGSIERIFDYIFNPKPIYILAPLRNVSNYEFQEARLDELLKYPADYREFTSVKCGGLGICCEKENVKEDYFLVDFKNQNIQNACIGLVKLHENKLYVLRGDKLVRKENVHIGLVNEIYKEYADVRRKTEAKRHPHCNGKYRLGRRYCTYFYKCISDKEFTIKPHDAAKNLRKLCYIACEEQRGLTDECYLLQEAFTVDKRFLDGIGFEICIFDKDITDFLEEGCCLKNVVTVTKAKPAAKDIAKKGQSTAYESKAWSYDGCIDIYKDNIE